MQINQEYLEIVEAMSKLSQEELEEKLFDSIKTAKTKGDFDANKIKEGIEMIKPFLSSDQIDKITKLSDALDE